MKDFIKEINIIDILGIGVPGCVMVLLLGGDQTAELLWMEQFQNHPLAFGIILLVVGSLAGMLIHELGDMIEKGLWLIPWLDPKSYAAVAVTTAAIPIDELNNNTYPSPNEQAAKWIRRISAGSSILIIFCASVFFNTAMWRAAYVTNSNAYVLLWAWVGLLPLAVPIVTILLYKKVLPMKDTTKWPDIQVIREANPYIQTVLVGHGNASKRTLYDGWRFVMRNMILVLAISNLISLWKPLDLYRRIAMMMMEPSGNMTFNLLILSLIVSVIIVLMMVRYYHYAFLRYKYSLEDFIALRTPAQQGASAPASQGTP